MRKITKTELYRYTSHSGVEKKGKIVVESGIFTAREIATNQKFRILPNKECVNDDLASSWLKKYNEYFFVLEPEMILATPEEVKRYLDFFKVKKCAFYNVLQIQQEKEKQLVKKEK